MFFFVAVFKYLNGMRNRPIEGRSQMAALSVLVRASVRIPIRMQRALLAYTYRELKGRTLTATLSDDISVVALLAALLFPVAVVVFDCAVIPLRQHSYVKCVGARGMYSTAG